VLERLKIFEYHAPYMFVLFDHNPEGLKVSGRARAGGRSQASSGSLSPGGPPLGHLGNSGNGADQTVVTITKARLVGPETKRFCDTLLGWVRPAPATSAAAAAERAMSGGTVGATPPVLLMQWGPPAAGFTFTATMSQVDIQYVRVSAVGVPTHALINLSLKEEPTILSMTNPTSGGRPGRASHMLLADESLMSVATKAFGDPNAWRAIARVNGIDDPAAVRPGDTIYLPARDELKELAELAGAGR
jgi:hypothetical protein